MQKENPWINLKIAFPGPVNTGPEMIDPERLNELKDLIITPEEMARHLKRLIDSRFSMLRFDDPREGPGFTGNYVLENFDGPKNKIVLN
jgi:hypothetical protein